MDIESFREYCLHKKASTESFPFNETVLVFKVMNKMFALTDLGTEFKIIVKCEAERAVELREQFESIEYAPHFDKKHWISIHMDESKSDQLILELIDQSYLLVTSKLTKKQKEELNSM